MTGAVHTIQTTDASIVCADGHVAHTKCTCTTLSFLLDHFLGLLDDLSCCHYGGHLAAVFVLVLVAVWGLSNDDDGAVKGLSSCNCNVAAKAVWLQFRSIGCFVGLYLCAGTDSTECALGAELSLLLLLQSLLLSGWGSLFTIHCQMSVLFTGSVDV
jgi:hypothetical protein